MVIAVKNSQTVRLNKDSWYNGTLPVSHVSQVNMFLSFWGLYSRVGNDTDFRDFGEKLSCTS